MTDAEKVVRAAHDQENIKYLNGACNFKNIGVLLAELDRLRKDVRLVTQPLPNDTLTNKVMQDAFDKHGIEYSPRARIIFCMGFRAAQKAHGVN